MSIQAMAGGGDLSAAPPVPRARVWWQSARAKWTGGILLALAIVGTVYWLVLIHPYVTTDDARIAATTVRVSNLGAGGQIVKLNVDEGSRVKAGDVLLELDHRDAEAQLQRAQARAALTARERHRLESLLAQRGIAPSEFDKARGADEVAQSDVKLAQLALEHTYLKSPTGGIVVQKLAEVGNLLESGQTAVAVVDIDHAWIAANVEETEVGDVRVGQPVTASIDEGGSLDGKVVEIRSATAAQFSLIPADNPSGNYIKLVQRIPVKIALVAAPSRPLRVGQSVEIKIKVR